LESLRCDVHRNYKELERASGISHAKDKIYGEMGRTLAETTHQSLEYASQK
jgi:hypothetical protein